MSWTSLASGLLWLSGGDCSTLLDSEPRFRGAYLGSDPPQLLGPPPAGWDSDSPGGKRLKPRLEFPVTVLFAVWNSVCGMTALLMG